MYKLQLTLFVLLAIVIVMVTIADVIVVVIDLLLLLMMLQCTLHHGNGLFCYEQQTIRTMDGTPATSQQLPFLTCRLSIAEIYKTVVAF